MAVDRKDVLTGDEALTKLRQLLKDFPIAFMVTVSAGATTHLMFQNDKEGTYLQLSGRASVVDDRPKLEELYTTLQRTGSRWGSTIRISRSCDSTPSRAITGTRTTASSGWRSPSQRRLSRRRLARAATPELRS